MYFKPLTVNGRTFVDGGLQANNPLGWCVTIPQLSTTDLNPGGS